MTPIELRTQAIDSFISHISTCETCSKFESLCSSGAEKLTLTISTCKAARGTLAEKIQNRPTLQR